MKKATKWIIAGGGAAATAAAGAYTAVRTISKKLLSIAMDREEPAIMRKGKEKITGNPEVANALRMSDDAAQVLEACGCADVEIISRDGIRLAGHFYECPTAKRIVVAMHGWRSTWAKDFGVISQFFHSNDCSVLYAEQRAQNQSEGEYMTFGLLERYDCLDWANWVNEWFGDSLPIYLAGVSMGATTVLLAAGRPLPPQVVGVLADCGFTRARDIIKKVIRQIKLPDNILYPLIKFGAKVYGHFDLEETPPVEAVKKCKVPVIFFHGEDDRFVPCDMSHENYEACRSRKMLVTTPDAGHGLCYPVDPEGYLKALREFFK